MNSIQMPNIRTTLADQENKVSYHVLSYRELTRQELIMAVRIYLSRHKKPKRGTEITIQTVIGI